jgi:hypothetical protein
MDRANRVSRRALAVLLLIAAAGTVAQPPVGNGEERALRKSDPIYLELYERRLVDRSLLERIRCVRGVLIVRPLGRFALVYCSL